MRWRSRERFEEAERAALAPWACFSAASAGRSVEEPEHPYRTAFQRDRDRIVHARAFRRLEFKTQVFVHLESDHYRNRLTHTIEAAQVARTIARALCLNEDLAEAIVLAHDLGHTPFGHAGEGVLAELMEAHGGFDHNRQSLRVVDLLEDRYPEFSGLNLTAETREGLLKYGSPWSHPVGVPPTHAQRSLEAQVADCADEIAYIHHDLDDGLRSGLLSVEQLSEQALWCQAEGVRRRGRDDQDSFSVARTQTIGALLNVLITDLIEATSLRLDGDPPADLADLRTRTVRYVGLSEPVETTKRDLKSFLSQNFYHHPDVTERAQEATSVMGDLFRAYRDRPELLPPHVRDHFDREGPLRAISDYIAGMTDRYALDERTSLPERMRVLESGATAD
jgi:dGTPase